MILDLTASGFTGWLRSREHVELVLLLTFFSSLQIIEIKRKLKFVLATECWYWSFFRRTRPSSVWFSARPKDVSLIPLGAAVNLCEEDNDEESTLISLSC